MSDLNREKGDTVIAEIGAAQAFFQPCDVSKIEDVDALIAAAISRFGRLDLLVNSAGIGAPPSKTPDLDPKDWLNVMAVNLHSIFYACRAAIPHMRGKSAAIVNIASISGLAGDIGFNAYNASKAAVINYTRTLAIDHALEGIRVNCVCPGLIQTPLTAAATDVGDLWDRWVAKAAMKRAGQPEEIADVIAYLLSAQASYVTGAAIVADGGSMAWTGQPNVLEAFGLA